MSSTLDWANLFEEEAPRLIRFLARFGPEISPEDIAQDTFTRLVAANPHDVASPRAYLFRTARNLALNELKRRRIAPSETVPDLEAFARDADAPSPEDAVVAADEGARLEAALAALPEHKRLALVLFKLDGLSHKEIGQRLGVSHRTVERYIADALRHCHKALAASRAQD